MNPMGVVPSIKVTVFVGVGLPATVAVKVTGEPAVDGFWLETFIVVVDVPVVLMMVSISAADTLGPLLASPG